MRPVTAIVIAALLVLIVGAFLWQLYLVDGF
jgi:signal peptidase I